MLYMFQAGSAHHQELKNVINILYHCQCSTCFRRFLRPSSGDQKLYTLLYTLAATASGSTNQAWHIPDAVCTVFELLMMGGETA